MESSRLKILFCLTIVLWAVLSVAVLFAQEASPKAEEQLTDISNRLDRIEKKQQDLSDDHQKILEEIDRLRKWVYHR